MKFMKCNIMKYLKLVFLLLFSQSLLAQRGYYVTTTGGNPAVAATYWNIPTTLQAALNAAVSGDTVLIAAGNYLPTTTNNRNISFVVKSGVLVRGSFNSTNGNNNGTPAGSTNAALFTILDGDIGTANDASDNSYHVVRIQGGNSILQNVTIHNGNANGAGLETNGGGALVEGTGISNLTGCTFLTCNASQTGGGVFVSATASLTGTTFHITGSTANNGGGIGADVQTTLILSNINILDCDASQKGGGIYSNGASLLNLYTSVIRGDCDATDGAGLAFISTTSLSLGNNLVAENTATNHGGGVYIDNPHIDQNLLAGNLTIANNFATNQGDNLWLKCEKNSEISNSIFWKGTFATRTIADANLTNYGGTSENVYNGGGIGTKTLFYSMVNETDAANLNIRSNNGFTGSTGMLYNINPLFCDNEINNQYMLRRGSPAKDTGNDTYACTTNTRSADLHGYERTCIVDRGATEYRAIIPSRTGAWNTLAVWGSNCDCDVPTIDEVAAIHGNSQVTIPTNTTVNAFSVYIIGGTLDMTAANSQVDVVSRFQNQATFVGGEGTVQFISGNCNRNKNIQDNANPYITFNNLVLNNQNTTITDEVTDCFLHQTIIPVGGGTCYNNATHTGIVSGTNIRVKKLLHLKKGNLLGNPTNTSLTLLSTATATAMVVNETEAACSRNSWDVFTNTIGTPYTNTTVQRHVTGHASGFAGVGYHYFSSQITNGTVAQFEPEMAVRVYADYYWYSPTYTNLATFPNFFYYDAQTPKINMGTDNSTTGNTGGFEGGQGGQGGWKCPAAKTDPLTAGRGYAVHIQQGTTVDLNGTLNNHTVTATVYKDASGVFSGWNLIGNPYPSPLDFDLFFGANNANIENVAYRRIPLGTLNNVTWATYMSGVGAVSANPQAYPSQINVGENLIASGQGFFVIAKNNGVNISFQNTHRQGAIYTNPTFYRIENTKQGLLKLALGNGTWRDESIVYFDTKAKNTFESNDAFKHFNEKEVPNLFWYSEDNKQIGINGLPIFETETYVPLALKIQKAGKHRLEILDNQYFGEDYVISVLDKTSQTKFPLKTPYELDLAVGTHKDRLVLIIEKIKQNDSDQDKIPVFPNPSADQVFVDTQKMQSAKGILRVVDLTGKVFLEKEISKPQSNQVEKIDVSAFVQGIYIIQILDGDRSYFNRFLKQ